MDASSTDPAQQAEVTTCYRHPGRETYVRCTRCDRYICPDCMREAAVGHQCVECVREGQKSIRQARTVFGGVVSAVPVVTYVLIGLNVLAYLGELLQPDIIRQFDGLGRGLRSPDGQYFLFGDTPYPGLETVGIAYGEWYRLITAAFLHLLPTQGAFGLTHIIFNMVGLWQLGRLVEEELGRLRFAAVYLLSALGGSVLHYVVAPDRGTVGASGAVFGVATAYFVISRRLNRNPLAANRLMGMYVLWLVLSAGVTSWQGHLGGLLTGGALTLAFAYAPAHRRTVLHACAAGGLLVLLVALVVVKTSQLTVV